MFDAARLGDEVSSSSDECRYPDGLVLFVLIVDAAQESLMPHDPVLSCWRVFGEAFGIVVDVVLDVSFDDDSGAVREWYLSCFESAFSILARAVEVDEFDVSVDDEHEEVVDEVFDEGAEVVVVCVAVCGGEWVFVPDESCHVVFGCADAVDAHSVSVVSLASFSFWIEDIEGAQHGVRDGSCVVVGAHFDDKKSEDAVCSVDEVWREFIRGEFDVDEEVIERKVDLTDLFLSGWGLGSAE